jgi:hypothetical protein
MNYEIGAELAESKSIRRRIVMCATREGETNPVDWAARAAWFLVADDWVAAIESALANPEYTGDPYSDRNVVTDQMILSAVQTRRTAQEQERQAQQELAARAAEQTSLDEA